MSAINTILGIVFLVLLIANLVALPQRFAWRRPGWRGWVHGLGIFTTGATLGLLCIGGLVTSHGAGMAVPDWPNTFGYNMFLFPVSGWVSGIFYEHTHRLWASGVGLLTMLLAVGIAWSDSRRWMRWLGLGAVALVIFQGVLGGLRVTEAANWIGIFHGCLAQAFLCLVAFLTLATSRWWLETSREATAEGARIPAGWVKLAVIAVALIYGQLILGASMRHAHMGLAVPDFPTAYGQIIPAMDDAAMEEINDGRFLKGESATTRTQITIHLAHRLGAVLVFVGIVVAVDRLLRRRQTVPAALQRGAWSWLLLVGVQILLGAWVVWSNKAADIATVHTLIGALILVTGVMLAVMAARLQWWERRLPAPAPAPVDQTAAAPVG
ncbi:MAG: COX15/CtaA family protein [Verrucomicrobiota bacterium]